MDLVTYVDGLPRGGKKILALQLGIASSYLSRLLAGDRSITAERALQIEEATLGLVTRHELRPDLQWFTSGAPVGKASIYTWANASPTLMTNLRPTVAPAQSCDSAVNPSSADAEAKLDPPETLAS